MKWESFIDSLSVVVAVVADVPVVEVVPDVDCEPGVCPIELGMLVSGGLELGSCLGVWADATALPRRRTPAASASLVVSSFLI
jgi:hypothetical protein